MPVARAPSRRKLSLRVAGLSALAFLLMFSYSVARPASESIFLETHGSERLPLVWLLVALGALACVTVYNRLVPGRDLAWLYGLLAAMAGLGLVALQLAWQASLPGTAYALYVWKDLYIIVLVEVYYSFCNAVFPIRLARWVYGLFGAMGSLGAIAGNLVVGAAAARWGSWDALWLVLPPLAASWLLAMFVARRAGVGASLTAGRQSPGLLAGVRIVRRSRYLLLMLLLIATVQLVVTLVDLQFNGTVERLFPDQDQRTALIGQVYAGVSVGTLLLHALTGPILRLAGVPLTLLAIPLLLGAAVVSMVVAPSFFTVAAAKLASKCFDYTLFRSAKEMLYIPLSYEEKTEGKAVVDMLTYRVAKGGASLLLMGLVALQALALVPLVALGAIGGWLGLTAVITRRFRGLVGREEELGGARGAGDGPG